MRLDKWFNCPHIQGAKMRVFEDYRATDKLIDSYREQVKDYQSAVNKVTDELPFLASILPPKILSKKEAISALMLYWKPVEIVGADEGYMLVQLRHSKNEAVLIEAQLVLLLLVEKMKSAKIQ